MNTNKTNLALLVALVLTVGWSSVSVMQVEPRDLKAEFAFSGVADVSREALEALSTTVVGLPCTTDVGTLPGVSDGNGNVGMSGPYPCTNVGLQALVPLAELGGGAGNDSWGWEDPDSEDPDNPFRVAIMGTGVGTAFVDVSNPTVPVVLGTVAQAGSATTGATGAVWRDIKVNDNHAFIVTERGGGMQVVDLTQLRALRGTPSLDQLDVLTTYTEHDADSNFHNIVINEDTDRAYLVGGTFQGGLHIVDIADPAQPRTIGAFATDGYTHDAQCVVYAGPDDDYNGTNAVDGEPSEICFAYNEDSLTIVDVTDPLATRLINKLDYEREGYTHQGWLTPDHAFAVFNDELDEGPTAALGTRTFMVELQDLDAAYTADDVKIYTHDTVSTDHNLYIRGDLIFEANYNAGLKIFRYTAEGLRNGELDLVGSFDVDPGLDVPAYGGAWNVFPYFDDDTIIVSSLDEGLYVLAFTDPGAPE
ncbi:hypothetical protein DVS28_a3216 [Euzebya pacifica]|uniref:Choice-of-anchor B family protein n=1 Tax=Euzebya pacifica TaxID=1608957 RepID=A0A346Y094_9ACTN|nr:choice-of-anchor B family protein [Euzebya pacifica]AXV07891.1 hypothetical protein DVS28_a3216 [Euzebya pacifica]